MKKNSTEFTRFKRTMKKMEAEKIKTALNNKKNKKKERRMN